MAKIQSQMKSFVKGMVRGREMNVLSVRRMHPGHACDRSSDFKQVVQDSMGLWLHSGQLHD